MTPSPIIFNRKTKRLQRNRQAANCEQHDFLIREVSQRLQETLDEEITTKFPSVLDIGSRGGYLSDYLKNRNDVQSLIQTDNAFDFIKNTENSIVCDEELLPFASESFNLITSLLNLHWVNDLPGALIQIQRSLRPNGLFLGAMLGGSTLHELRQATLEAELEFTGGISPRISPFVEVKEAGQLLHRAGFSLPVSSHETITVMYPDALTLMHDLRGMGESNALTERNKNLTSRNLITAIAATYSSRFGTDDGKIPATFEIITLTGWKN